MSQQEKIVSSSSTIYSTKYPLKGEERNSLREYFKGDDKKIKMLCQYFKYEVDMLRFADSKIDEFERKLDEFERKGNKSKCRIYELKRNMALEAFLVHWRGLTEFFYSDGKRVQNDDARALDFIQKSSLEKIRSPKPDWLKKRKDRANKEIAHLTYSRYSGKPPAKDWHYKEMKEHLKKIINLFNEQINLKYQLNLKYWER